MSIWVRDDWLLIRPCAYVYHGWDYRMRRIKCLSSEDVIVLSKLQLIPHLRNQKRSHRHDVLIIDCCSASPCTTRTVFGPCRKEWTPIKIQWLPTWFVNPSRNTFSQSLIIGILIVTSLWSNRLIRCHHPRRFVEVLHLHRHHHCPPRLRSSSTMINLWKHLLSLFNLNLFPAIQKVRNLDVPYWCRHFNLIK